MKLLLFDVDGTLVHSGGAGRRGMEKAFEQMYGISNGFESISMFGMTDPLIFKAALTNHDIPWKREDEERFKALYLELLRAGIHAPHPKRRMMPGVTELLDEISTKQHCISSLLTGNWKEGAEIKLGFFDLNRYFELGAFADDSPIRKELVPVAVKRIEEARSIQLDPRDVFVIGDTPLDIQCARPFGAQTVVVATGIHTREDLLSEGPDYFFPDFTDTAEVVKVFS